MKTRLSGSDRKPQLTRKAALGLSHIIAVLESQPVPLQYAETIAGAREYLVKLLAHHNSPIIAEKRKANREQSQAGKLKRKNSHV